MQLDFMDLSDTGPRVRQLSHFWGGGGREELAIIFILRHVLVDILAFIAPLKSDTFLSSANPWL